MNSTRHDIVRHIAEQISSLYSPEECRIIARTVAAHLRREDPIKFMVDPHEQIEIEGVDEAVRDLISARPLQYILGHTEFYGLDLSISEGALIPRPETEELVDWVVSLAQKLSTPEPRILDLCTGSGCIALAIKSALPQASVTAVDLSDDALTIARRNKERLYLDVEILKDDVLQGVKSLSGREFDIIVSNPPYIPLSEKSAMHHNVVDHEPHMALFVEDHDPLIFYRSIARSAEQMLCCGGYLLFEIHELLHAETSALLRAEGFQDVELRHDFRDKPRMICSRKRIR
ncbi:MAG: peptide chain release factor N(5)-glutamine methyltransferase [Alistipes sp.]|nr:peptide chain release factor N(5)-glutamine methyltransferase [Alistipes sp.]